MRMCGMAVAALASALLLAGTADAAIVYGANFCKAADYDFAAPSFNTENQIIVDGPSNKWAYLSCPMVNTKNHTTGLAAGSVRLNSSSTTSYCLMLSSTEFGSILASQTTYVTTTNTDVSLNVYSGVNSSFSYGYFNAFCVLSGGSRMMSYRYLEQ
ncbi:MAG TPA: hypothetical protein VFQ35_25160 [Polyangiaceae bacterium]|nr:hypothetical protein [Polyangiaceae bacterium]